MYKQFHLDEPWDSENNKKLIPLMPQVYRSPGIALKPGMTRYLTFRNKDSAFPGKDRITMADITDGTSNTLMAAEVDAAHAVVWTKPDDLDFNPAKPANGLKKQPAGGFLAVFCDGSARFISDNVDLEALRNLVNRHDGKIISLP